MNVIGALVAIVLVAAPPPTSGDWSITPNTGETLSPLSGAAIATLAPGASVEGEFTIAHTDAIDGPVDITAKTTDPVSSLETHLIVTTTLNGHAGPPQTLGSLLRNGTVARAGALLTPGPATLDVAVTMDPATTTDMRDSIGFTFFVTVSNQPVILPGQPGDPGTGGGTGTTPGSGGKILAYTGQAVSIFLVTMGAGFLFFGLVLVLRRRRRASSPPDVRGSS